MNELSELQKIIGYNFKDSKLLTEALTHSSFAKEKENYERLEFLGDRVLGLIISSEIYKRFEKDDEGELAKKLSILVCKDTLKKIANNIYLKNYLKLSNEIKNSSIDSIKANSLEALIAAIYLDSDLNTTTKILIKLWNNEIQEIDLSNHDPKSRLQEWCMKRNNKLPVYSLLKKVGPEHEPEFTIEVRYNENLFASAKGKNKQDAEVNAAKKLLHKIEKRKS